jgi:hypothetical protein
MSETGDRTEQIDQEMAALMAENERLTARVAELEAALHRYGGHDETCSGFLPGAAPDDCDCGLAAAGPGA